MKENYIYLGMIIDRSGSMAQDDKIVEAINGVNNIIEEKKVDPKFNYDMFLTIFDNEIEKVYEGDIKLCDHLTEETIYPRGMTSLYDAIGFTITEIGKKISMMLEDDQPSKVVITVITDGHENNSREYNSHNIKKMIDTQTDTFNWEFIFMGATKEGTLSAHNMGFRQNRTVQFSNTGGGTRDAFALYSSSISKVACDSFEGYSSSDARTELDKEINEDKK